MAAARPSTRFLQPPVFAVVTTVLAFLSPAKSVPIVPQQAAVLKECAISWYNSSALIDGGWRVRGTAPWDCASTVGVACDAAGYVVNITLNSAGCKSASFGCIPNTLVGQIPDSIGSLATLTHLDLSSNALNGSIPFGLANLTQLHGLLLGNNNLEGDIPQGISRLSHLSVLTLGYNLHLGASIPAYLSSLTNLTLLQLSGITLNGTIPGTLGNLLNLQYLGLGGSKGGALSGTLPAGLSTLTQLTFFSVQHNTLVGPIPGYFGNMTNLQTLYLGHNNFSGSVPSTLGNLKQVTMLDLSYNMLSGALPYTLAANTHFGIDAHGFATLRTDHQSGPNAGLSCPTNVSKDCAAYINLASFYCDPTYLCSTTCSLCSKQYGNFFSPPPPSPRGSASPPAVALAPAGPPPPVGASPPALVISPLNPCQGMGSKAWSATAQGEGCTPPPASNPDASPSGAPAPPKSGISIALPAATSALQSFAAALVLALCLVL